MNLFVTLYPIGGLGGVCFSCSFLQRFSVADLKLASSMETSEVDASSSAVSDKRSRRQSGGVKKESEKEDVGFFIYNLHTHTPVKFDYST